MTERPTLEQQKKMVQHWKRTGPLLQRIRREELRRWSYDWKSIDDLLDMGDRWGHSRFPSGMVEMQRFFMKAARKQGLLPASVRETPPPYGESPLRTLGDPVLLNRPMLALLCSVRCPGALAAETFDLVQRLRRQEIAVVSGFHSPMEKECLAILLRSTNTVIWCLARGMIKAVPRDLRGAVREGRMLIVSPFPEKVRRVTAETAAARNRAVAAMAAAVFVPHAAAGSKMEALCRETLSAGKPLFTFDHPANAAMLDAGAQAATAGLDWKRIIGR